MSTARGRNSLREQLWSDERFAHRWLCHPEGGKCDGGSDCSAEKSRVDFYQSELEGGAR